MYILLAYFEREGPSDLDRRLIRESSVSLMLRDENAHSKHSYITCLHKIHSLLATPMPSALQSNLLNC